MKFLLLFLLVIASTSLASEEPISADRQAKIMQTCYKLLRTPPEVREKFERNLLNDDDDGQDVTCLVRCGGIVSGMYDDEAGWNVDMVVGQAHGQAGVDGYREAFARCSGEVRAEQEDYCRKSFLQFRCGMSAWKENIKE